MPFNLIRKLYLIAFDYILFDLQIIFDCILLYIFTRFIIFNIKSQYTFYQEILFSLIYLFLSHILQRGYFLFEIIIYIFLGSVNHHHHIYIYILVLNHNIFMYYMEWFDSVLYWDMCVIIYFILKPCIINYYRRINYSL